VVERIKQRLTTEHPCLSDDEADNEMKLAKMEIKALRSRRLGVLCVFVGLIRHTQQIRELSVFNGAKENAEDAETLRTRRVGVSLG
jgi:hypothetical protein